MSVIIVVGIILVLNLISEQLYLRFDFTEDNQYTLSNATKDILKELTDPVTVTAYFSKDLPPDIERTRQDFRDLLIEYNNRSGGMVVYEFIDPGKNDKQEQEALQNGIQPVMINVREKDQVKQQKAFLGALIQLGEKKEVMPFIQPGTAMEYSLSTAIKKISVESKPSIGLLQGHGEPSIAELSQVNEGLSILYNFEPVTITDTTKIPDRIKTLVLIRPIDSIPIPDFTEIDKFMKNGGRVLVAMNRVDGDLRSAYGKVLNTGLEGWLRRKGINVKPDFVVDASCGAVTVQQRQGNFSFSTNVSFPYLPVIKLFADHPITKGLEAVIMQFPSTIEYFGDSTKTFTPIATTSEKSGSYSAPLYFNIEKQWTENDFPLKHITVGAVLEGNFGSSDLNKMVIISDGDFIVNGPGRQARQLQPDNVNLLVNGIDWLIDDTGLIELRTKGVTARPIKELEDSKKALLKYLNFLLPIILVIIYGVFRMQQKRNLRIKRLEENYA